MEIVGGRPKPKRRKARKILSLSGVFKKRNYRIDEEDFNAVKDIIMANGITENLPKEAQKLVSLTGRGRRVDKLIVDDGRIRTLPASIGNLQNLQELRIFELLSLSEVFCEILCSLQSLRKFTIISLRSTSLPGAIGRLQNLEELDIRDASHLTSLPEEIGDLKNLKTLAITYSKLRTLPSSIGRLQNLEEIHIRGSRSFTKLPEEIGELKSLRYLDLSRSTITYLPASFGRLQNLKYLDLLYARSLTCLPKEFGDLHNLQILNLAHTDALTCLPKEIGNLCNLQILDLSYKSTLTCLPEEIGDLHNLKELYLYDRHVHINIVNAIPQQVWFSIFCRRAKLHTKPFVTFLGNEDSARIMMKLWPQLLRNSKRVYNDARWIYRARKFPEVVEEADAIYQILSDCRGSFVNIFS